MMKTAAFVAFVASAAEATRCIPTAQSGDFTVTCDDVRYVFSVPEECTGGGCGLIFDTHGATMDGRQEDAHTQLRKFGNADGYIVENPEKPNRSWAPNTDHAKLEDFLRQSVEAYDTDANRVHVTGFSQGGYASWQLLCRASDIICSAAPMCASGLDQWGAGYGSTCFSDTGPEFQRPVMYIAGTTDTLANFNLFEPQVNNVRRAYGIEAGAEEVLSSDASHSWTRYGNSTATFETIQHDYRANLLLGGHCFTVADGNGGSGLYTCNGPWNVGEQLMDFFKANPCNRQ